MIVAVMLLNLSANAVALVDAASTWRSHNISSYSVAYQRSCFCKLQEIARVRITVQDRVVTDVRYLESRRTGRVVNDSVLWQEVVEGEAVEEIYKNGFLSIDKLFHDLLHYHSREGVLLEAKFHPKYGYPTRVRIDPYPDLVDDEITYELSELSITEE